MCGIGTVAVIGVIGTMIVNPTSSLASGIVFLQLMMLFLSIVGMIFVGPIKEVMNVLVTAASGEKMSVANEIDDTLIRSLVYKCSGPYTFLILFRANAYNKKK